MKHSFMVLISACILVSTQLYGRLAAQRTIAVDSPLELTQLPNNNHSAIKSSNAENIENNVGVGQKVTQITDNPYFDIKNQLDFAQKSLEDLQLTEKETGYEQQAVDYIQGLIEQAQQQYQMTLDYFAKNTERMLEGMAWDAVSDFSDIEHKFQTSFMDIKREIQGIKGYFIARYYEFLKEMQTMPELGQSDMYQSQVEQELDILADVALEHASNLLDRLQYSIKKDIAFADLQKTIDTYEKQGQQEQEAMQKEIESERKTDWQKLLQASRNVFSKFGKEVAKDFEEKVTDFDALVASIEKQKSVKDGLDVLPKWMRDVGGRAYEVGKKPLQDAVKEATKKQFDKAKQSLKKSGQDALQAGSEELRKASLDRLVVKIREYLPQAPSEIVTGLQQVVDLLVQGKKYEARSALLQTVQDFGKQKIAAVLEATLLHTMPTSVKAVANNVVKAVLQGNLQQARDVLAQSVMSVQERMQQDAVSAKELERRVFKGFEEYQGEISGVARAQVADFLHMVFANDGDARLFLAKLSREYVVKKASQVMQQFTEKLPPLSQKPVQDLLQSLSNPHVGKDESQDDGASEASATLPELEGVE